MTDIIASLLDDDEASPESPSVVAPTNDVFISAHFDHLGADQFFGASQPLEQSADKRMSISTRFLSSSGYVIVYQQSLYNAHKENVYFGLCNVSELHSCYTSFLYAETSKDLLMPLLLQMVPLL